MRRRRRAADRLNEAMDAVVEAVDGEEPLDWPQLFLDDDGDPDEWDRGETVVSLDDLDLSFEPDEAFTEELAAALAAERAVVELPYLVHAGASVLEGKALGGRYKTVACELDLAEAMPRLRLRLWFWPVDYSAGDVDDGAIAERAMALV